jgi:LysR family transcriptional regulator, carnitine catabolism transcriptional activator
MQVSMLQLRAFVAVARYGSFTLAAEALNRTQPAITVQIKQLEQALGLSLFDRTTRQLRLTTVGLELVPVLSQMLQQLDNIIASSQDLRDKRTGVVRIGALPSVAAGFLPPRIARFRKKHPGVQFLISDTLGDKIVAMVKSGEVEFGITDIHTGSNIETTPVVLEQMCAFYLEGHPIEQAAKLDVEELAKHDLILLIHGSAARRVVDSAFAGRGRLAVAACEVSYMSTAVGMVQAGLGVALLPRRGVQLQIDPRLRCRPIEGPGFTRRIGIIRLKNKTLSPAADAFIQMLMTSKAEKDSMHSAPAPRQGRGRTKAARDEKTIAAAKPG